jgi:paraquat-inducible protein B
LSETIDRDDLPRATLTPSRRSRISAVWLIPLVAAVVAIGIAVHRILNEGPTISIVFKSAEGVEAGKTPIRYKDVKIGEVTAVELYENYSKVMVTAQIDKHAEGLMVEDAEFWVVHPRVTLSGISGLSTLLSGNYIGFERGKSKKTQHRFTGLETAPVVTIDQPGRQFQLTADDLGSLGIGSPVYFRRLNVGQLIAYDLAADGKDVTIRIFITAPYDRFVTAGTRFWNASGLDVSLGAGGVDVRTESLVSLLIGGVAFETPAFAPTSEPAADTAFALYKDRATAMKQPEAIARRYVAYFDDSMRGLSVGAPVTLLGLPAGEVTDVGIDLDPKTLSLRGRVEIVTYPDRVVARLQTAQTATGKDIVHSEQRSRAFFQRLIEERGLRAQLRSGSLITGQLYVAFDFFPDAEKAQIDWSQEIPVVPTVPATLANLQDKITGILAKLDKIPYEAIGIDVKKTLETLEKAIEDIASGINPGLKSAIAELRRALASANRVLKDTGATLLGKDAPGQLELRDALQEVARAARSVRVLSDYLERHPAALLRGKSGEKP